MRIWIVELQSGTLAIVITYIMAMVGVLQWALRQTTEVENQVIYIYFVNRVEIAFQLQTMVSTK